MMMQHLLQQSSSYCDRWHDGTLLHTSATTPRCVLFSVASATNLVGHIIFTSLVHRHKKKVYLEKGKRGD